MARKKDRLECFMSHVSISDTGCWEWTGALRNGYGVFGWWENGKGRTQRAHRWYYQHVNGPIDPSLDLDHLCHNRKCVNPAHLDPASRRENLLRSDLTLTFASASRTHCPRGHEYSHTDKKGHRRCRACESAMRKERRLLVGRKEGNKYYAPKGASA